MSENPTDLYQKFLAERKVKEDARRERRALFNPLDVLKEAAEAKYLEDEQLGIVEYGS